MPGPERFADRLRIAADDDEVGPRGGIRVLAAQFPIPQRPERDVQASRELLLRQAERPADDAHLRGAAHGPPAAPR